MLLRSLVTTIPISTTSSSTSRPSSPLQPPEVEKALGGFLERFGRRLWRLRVTGAEIRIICTDPATGMPYPLRVVINNTSGYVIQVEMYAERKSEKGGDWVFHSIGGTTKIGSMHLRPVSTPYPTKEWLQPKRYKAHLMGTQYVYDFPELFRQAHSKQLDQGCQQAQLFG